MARNMEKYLNITSWNRGGHPTCGLITVEETTIYYWITILKREEFFQYCLEIIFRNVEVVETIWFLRKMDQYDLLWRTEKVVR
jgi:hypothetical protein